MIAYLTKELKESVITRTAQIGDASGGTEKRKKEPDSRTEIYDAWKEHTLGQAFNDKSETAEKG